MSEIFPQRDGTPAGMPRDVYDEVMRSRLQKVYHNEMYATPTQEHYPQSSGMASSNWTQDGGWGSFSRDEVEELSLQGMSPWDPQAEAALQVLFPGRGYS